MELHIEAVSDLKWVDPSHTKLVGIVKFAEFQEASPFSFCADAVVEYPHEADFWDRSTAGEFGPIAAYEPPSIEELRAAMPELTARQLRLGLINGGIVPDQVRATIVAMPPGADREKALVEWEYATTFDRLHPLISIVGSALGLSGEQIDAMWTAATAL